ncbi:Trm112 family protein [Sphaerotilaceae bacterium SBD11-9]
MDTRLLELLVCPLCKGPLEHLRPPIQAEQELVCRADRLAFPVRDGMPIMLEAEARSLDAPAPNAEASA